ncbi:MAG: flagellar biosynthesis protein FlgL [Xanthobacteraceae bacterium]|nr:flagellar biosynthesis protein FlgL [Xanthobacteraceae bacterium]
MTIDGVGNRASYIGSSILNMKSQLNELSQQLATGQVSNTYAGEGVNRGLAVGLRAQISALDAYADTATNINTRINAANLSLQGLADLNTQVKTAASGSSTALGADGQTAGQISAQAAFASAIELLNARAGDRYLFSGRATDTPPTASADEILNGSADGSRAGLTQLIAERKSADLGADGMGRLTLSDAGASPLRLAEDADPSAFGLKLSAVNSTLNGATVSGPTGTPAGISIDLNGVNPNAGDKISVSFSLPDGSSESVTLTATTTSPPQAGEFMIGADAAATSDNLRTALQGGVKTLANTALVAASAVAASNNFFDSPPLRVDTSGGGSLSSATGLVAGTDADTVSWYTGETAQGATDAARGTAVARVDSGIAVQYGARADEQAFRAQLQTIAVYAAVTTQASDPDAGAQVAALSRRVTQKLSPPAGVQTIEDIQADFAGAQTAIKAAADRQAQVKTMTQTMLDSITTVSPEETSMKILALQTSLSASYQTTSMLYKLSLTNFI